ncbi:hypothetical protein [Streptosporangium sp. NPDC023615]|uniref:hypothetical protein n=1 Tax=Streptosporangium sp. NPDC023615 TaxID=3154794 RepID=UPI0034466137
MTTVRGRIAVGVIAPIVFVFAVFTAASPAWAVARLDAPSRVTSNQTVTLSGTVDHLFDAVLFIDGRQVAKGDREVSYAWRPRDHRNGSHRIRLEQKGKVLGAEWHRTSRTLVQVASPVTPGGPVVRLRGRQVTLTWRRGPEPDLRRYEITASRTGRIGSVGVKSACSDSVCGATVTVPANAAGRRIGFAVRALRSDGAGGTVASGDSAATSVTVPQAGATGHRKAGARQGAGVRSGRGEQESADRNSVRSGDEKSVGNRNDDERAGVRDLPRLPAKEPVTTASGSHEPSEAPLTSATKDDAVTVPTGRDIEKDGTKQESEEGVTATSGSETDGTTGAGDLVVVDRTDVTTRSSDSPSGGMSLYGLVIAGALILLVAGAHGGAWFRRRSLIMGRGPAGRNDVATRSTGETNDVTASSDLRSLMGDASDGEHRDGRSRGVATDQAAGTSVTGRIREAGRAVMAGGNGRFRRGAEATTASERPTVVLAVVKTRSILKGAPSASREPVHLISPDRIGSDQPSLCQPLSDPLPSDPLPSYLPPFDQAPFDRASSDRASSDRAPFSPPSSSDRSSPALPSSGPPRSDSALSDSAPPGRIPFGRRVFGAPVRPIAVRPASLRLAAVQRLSSPPVETEGHQGARRQTNAEQREKGEHKADAKQRGEGEHREEPGRRAETEPPGRRQADPSQAPVRWTRAERATRTERAQDARAETRYAKADQARGERIQRPSVRVRVTRIGMTHDEAMRVETVRPGRVQDERVQVEGVEAKPVEAERVDVEPVDVERVKVERVEVQRVRGGSVSGETVRTRRGKVVQEKGERSGNRSSPDATAFSPGTSPGAAPPPVTNAAAPSPVRVAHRWDDYLPPAPRSMEDSGFWGRPQPGATDFWGDDRHIRDE